MKIRFAAALIATVIISTGIACGQSVDPRAEQLWQQARQMTYSQAFPILLQAAQLGHPKAQAALGSIYWQGMANVPRDYAKSAFWYQKSAAQGNRSAQFNLAGLYTQGLGGLPADLRKAAALLLASARQGYGPAEAALGTSYEMAEGVPHDRRAAIYWLQQAAAQGDRNSALMAQVLSKPGTPTFTSESALAGYIIAQTQRPTGGHGCVPNLDWHHGYGTGPMLYCR